MTPQLFRRELCFAALVAADAEEALRLLARALTGAGLVRPSFEAAVLAREATSPTALPLSGRKVAVPHTDPEHVIQSAVACCTLARPVQMGEMGDAARQLPVEVIVMLALTDHESAQQELVRIIERFQAPSFVDELCAATAAGALFTLLVGGHP